MKKGNSKYNPMLLKLDRFVADYIACNGASIHDVVQNRILQFPPDKYGTPCLLNDIVYFKDVKHTVVAITNSGKIAIKRTGFKHNNSEANWIRSTKVSHWKN